MQIDAGLTCTRASASLEGSKVDGFVRRSIQAARCDGQRSMRLPNSTTSAGGMRKYRSAAWALRSRKAYVASASGLMDVTITVGHHRPRPGTCEAGDAPLWYLRGCPTCPVAAIVEFGVRRTTNWCSRQLRHELEEVMKYLCLAYEEEEKLNALSRSEWDALRSDTLAYVEALRESGHLIVTRPAKRSDRRDRAGSKRQAVGDRRPLRRDEGVAGRLLPDRRQGPERSHPGGVTLAGTPWEHRGAAHRGRAQTGPALRIITTGGDV